MEDVTMSFKHGFYRTKLYYIWVGMKQRCNCVSNHAFIYYGARRIHVCDEWQNDFKTFQKWAYANGYDENAPKMECTLDRINNNKGYSPDNCRWVSKDIQANNNRHNINITYQGKTQTIAQCAKDLGINYWTLRSRLTKCKMPVEVAFSNNVKGWKDHVE